MTSRQEIAAALGFSMPTVFQYVNDLMEKGLIMEAGEYGSTGGRKAKILKVCGDFRYAIGAEVKNSCVRMVLLDFSGTLVDKEIFPIQYENTFDFYQSFGACVQRFALKNSMVKANPQRLLGVGVSLPGIIDPSFGVLRQSRTLNVANVGLASFSRSIPYDVSYENDANNAAFAEMGGGDKNIVYLSLNDTVDGAIVFRSEIYRGDHFRSAKFGHMAIEPDGRMCYCGKRGCVDIYCSAKRLSEAGGGSLDKFFARMEHGDQACAQAWDEYLHYLALTVSNIHTIFDCRIILGGDVGCYMKKFIPQLEDRLREANEYEPDLSYIELASFPGDSSSIGAASQLIRRFVDSIDEI